MRECVFDQGVRFDDPVLIAATGGAFRLSECGRTRNASWVLEYLTKDSLRVVDDTDRTRSNFHTDILTPEQFRVHPNLFLKSGYDKGHLAPASVFFLVLTHLIRCMS